MFWLSRVFCAFITSLSAGPSALSRAISASASLTIASRSWPGCASITTWNSPDSTLVGWPAETSAASRRSYIKRPEEPVLLVEPAEDLRQDVDRRLVPIAPRHRRPDQLDPGERDVVVQRHVLRPGELRHARREPGDLRPCRDRAEVLRDQPLRRRRIEVARDAQAGVVRVVVSAEERGDVPEPAPPTGRPSSRSCCGGTGGRRDTAPREAPRAPARRAGCRSSAAARS